MAGDGKRQEGASEPWWRVGVDANRCSLCEVCGRRCPTNAIRSEQTDGVLALLFDHELCDGCRDCLSSCPEDAIALLQINAPPDGTGGKVLASTKMLVCSVCGAHFAPETKLRAAARRGGADTPLIREQCPLCRRTQMVARLIEEKQTARGKKAEYRTGKKWRWKPVVEGDRDAPPCPEVLARPTDQDPLTPKPQDNRTPERS